MAFGDRLKKWRPGKYIKKGLQEIGIVKKDPRKPQKEAYAIPKGAGRFGAAPRKTTNPFNPFAIAKDIVAPSVQKSAEYQVGAGPGSVGQLRQAPQYGDFARQAREQYVSGADQEQRNINYLRNVAKGLTGPSAAELQARAGGDAARRQAFALAAQDRSNPLAARRQAMIQGSQAQLEAGQQAGILRAQEQESARNQLTEALGGYSNRALEATGTGLRAGESEADLRLRAATGEQRGRLDEAKMQYGAAQDYEQAQQAYEAAKNEPWLLNTAAKVGDTIGSVYSLGASSALKGGGGEGQDESLDSFIQRNRGTSDRRAKKNISAADDELDELLSKLKAFAFEYKDRKKGPGKRVGVMAQDLEKSRLGKTMVSEGEDGLKTVDLAKMLSMSLAASARLAERLDQIEGRAA